MPVSRSDKTICQLSSRAELDNGPQHVENDRLVLLLDAVDGINIEDGGSGCGNLDQQIVQARTGEAVGGRKAAPAPTFQLVPLQKEGRASVSIAR